MKFDIYTRQDTAIIPVFKFAWLPCYMRSTGSWVWLTEYTRVYRWSTRDGRYRTIWTIPGHQEHASIPTKALMEAHDNEGS